MKRNTVKKGLIIVIAILAICIPIVLLLSGSKKDTEKENPTASSKEVTETVTIEEASEETTTLETTQEQTTEETKEAPKLELSGNPEDSYTISEDCYVEGEDVILYLQKGMTVNGDILIVTEKVMSDLTETTGLNFENNYPVDDAMECRDLYYEPGLFTNMNVDATKVNVLVIDQGGSEAWASDHNAIVDIEDYNYEESCYQVLYHELTHVLQFRNGADLGSVMDEGYATYTSYVCQMEHNIPAWSAYQYFLPVEDVAKPLIEGGEASFLFQYEEKDTNYQYGFRFIMFLTETYGEDIYSQIMDEAHKKGFSCAITVGQEEESLEENTQLLIESIKSHTSEDVFDEFANWYVNKWDGYVNDKTNEINTMSNFN